MTRMLGVGAQAGDMTFGSFARYIWLISLTAVAVGCHSYPLHDACARGDSELVRSLLKQGAPVNQPDGMDRTPLHLAVQHDHELICEVLLSHGANPNLADRNGAAPLHVAAFYDRLEIVQMLLKHKASPSPKDGAGDTPLHIACRAVETIPGVQRTDHLETATALLDAGADPVARNKARQTPMDAALSTSNSPVLYLLRKRGVRE